MCVYLPTGAWSCAPERQLYPNELRYSHIEIAPSQGLFAVNKHPRLTSDWVGAMENNLSLHQEYAGYGASAHLQGKKEREGGSPLGCYHRVLLSVGTEI